MLNKIAGDYLSTYFTSNLDLRLEKDVNTKKYRNITFNQYYNLEVLNSNLRLKINSDNKLCSFNLNFHNDIDISTLLQFLKKRLFICHVSVTEK